MPDTPQRDCCCTDTRVERDMISSGVARQTLPAIAFSVLSDERVLIVYRAVEVVEHVASQHCCKGHHAPVLRKPIDAKSVRDDGGKDSKEHAVG